MALNPAAANVSDTSTGTKLPDQSPRVRLSRQFTGSNSRQEIAPDSRRSVGFSTSNADTLYSIRIAGYGSQSDQTYRQDQTEYGSSKKIYGDYWDASLTVFSLASFEAQLFIQMSPDRDNPRATPQQGNEAYISTRSVLEAAAVTNTDEDNVMDEDQANLHVDLRA